MKRLSLIPVCLLMLLVLLPSFTNVAGGIPLTEFRGTSPPIEPLQPWSLAMTDGWVHAGDVIHWNWSASGKVTFRVAYTTPPDLTTIVINGRLMEDGIVANETGWYGLTWFNNDTANVTVKYTVDVFTPLLRTFSIADGSYLNSRTLLVQGMTEGFATGVLVGTDALHLHKADLVGDGWTGTVALAEGRNTVIIESYYWLRPLGTLNFTLTRTVNVTVDTVLPSATIVSPSNNTSIRGREVPVYWNCSDAVGLLKVDMRIDNGSWVTVNWGDTLGLGYTPIGLSTGEHFIEVRATDRAGNQVVASTTVRTDSNDWSLGGPMYGLPTIGIILAAIVLSLVAYLSYARPRPDAQPPPVPVNPPVEPPAEPPVDPKAPGPSP